MVVYGWFSSSCWLDHIVEEVNVVVWLWWALWCARWAVVVGGSVMVDGFVMKSENVVVGGGICWKGETLW